MRSPDQGVRVAFLPVGDSPLELLEPTPDTSPIARHLERRGAGTPPHLSPGAGHPGGDGAALGSGDTGCSRRNRCDWGPRLPGVLRPSEVRRRRLMELSQSGGSLMAKADSLGWWTASKKARWSSLTLRQPAREDVGAAGSGSTEWGSWFEVSTSATVEKIGCARRRSR